MNKMFREVFFDGKNRLVSVEDLLKENKILQEKLDIAMKALEWYDGLENLLVGWEIATGQKKGTAKKTLKQIKEVK